MCSTIPLLVYNDGLNSTIRRSPFRWYAQIPNLEWEIIYPFQEKTYSHESAALPLGTKEGRLIHETRKGPWAYKLSRHTTLHEL